MGEERYKCSLAFKEEAAAFLGKTEGFSAGRAGKEGMVHFHREFPGKSSHCHL